MKLSNIGADIDEPGRVLVMREEFTKSTYIKVWIKQNGEAVLNNAPINIILGLDRWRWWRLGDTKLFIAYDPNAEEPNQWWKKCFKDVLSSCSMYGDLVIFRHHTALNMTWREIKLKIRRYLYDKYSEQRFSPLIPNKRRNE